MKDEIDLVWDHFISVRSFGRGDFKGISQLYSYMACVLGVV